MLSDMPRISKNTLRNSHERKTSGLFTCNYFDSLCRCSFHGFSHILFTSRVFFLLMRFIFEDWLAKGHAGAAAWPLHITPTASFIKNDQICTKSVEVLCIENIMWLFHSETFRGKHHHDTAATDQCYWRCGSYCKRNEHRTRLFEHL